MLEEKLKKLKTSKNTLEKLEKKKITPNQARKAIGLPEIRNNKKIKKYKLCYIDWNKAWFTDNFKEQWRR